MDFDGTFGLVLTYALIGSMIPVAAGAAMLYGSKSSKVLEKYAAPFAAGALLAAAFGDLLPEAVGLAGDAELVGVYLLLGVVIYFIFERFLRYFHHHHEHEDTISTEFLSRKLIITADTMHNFLDGVAIAAATLIDPTAGLAAAIAVSLHEIPQELGDFGLLLKSGMSRKSVMVVNVLSAFATVVGAGLIWSLGTSLDSAVLAAVVAATAGFFIYIALSDIVPTIHSHQDQKTANQDSLLFLAGIFVVYTIGTLLV